MKLLKFNTRSEFDDFVKLNSGLNDLDAALASENNGVYGSVVFIVDTGEIWANNKINIPGQGEDFEDPNLDDYVLKSQIATVAISGNYSDLNGVPVIPAQLSDLTDDSTHRVVTDTEKSTWNAKSNFSGSYTDLTNKPTIPTVDSSLSTSSTNAVRNSVVTKELNKKGTYSKPSTGIPKSDLASDVQTKIDKDNITYGVVNHGTSSTTFSVTPNVFHIWGTVTRLNITLATPTDSSIMNEYLFQFTSGSTATSLSTPSTVVWVSEPNIEANKTYQVSIVNNIGIIASVNA